MVRDDKGTVAGACVRLQGTCKAVPTDTKGRFRLPGRGGKRPVVASKAGYRLAAADSRRQPLTLWLKDLPEKDNEDYGWIDPVGNSRKAGNCGNCHEGIYQEWQASGHAQAAVNPRFLSLYDGRLDKGGNARSWNLSREHPLGAGVCAACHAPTYSDSTLEYDLAKVSGLAARGVHCDYCHKVVDAPVDKLGTRFGRDGLKLLRPRDNDLLFYGPLDDAVRPGESFAYLPLYKESRYCASCHEGIVFGVPVYGTYSEWLASPARGRGQECQTCHMPPTGKMTNIAPGKGGIDRPAESLASHGFPGGTADMLRRCLSAGVSWESRTDGIQAVVTVKADHVGHRVPTGFIDRHLVLVVEALGITGVLLKTFQGPHLPAAAGKRLAGHPGRLFAKQLPSPEGEWPIPFWLPHGDLADSRLFPGKAERAEFLFPPQTSALRVRLLYRRFWPIVADERGWTDNEVVVLEQVVPVPRSKKSR